jgi:hypothetical protein
VWDGDLLFGHGEYPILIIRSKPTVWDGDRVIATLFGGTSTPNSSKPTVWDGDPIRKKYFAVLEARSKF